MRRSADFTAAVRRGRRGSSPSVTVHLSVRDPSAAGDADAGARVGFVVSRAVGPAVVRNRVRRRLRHLMRARLSGMSPRADLVVRAQPAAASVSGDVLARDLDQALHRAASTSSRSAR